MRGNHDPSPLTADHLFYNSQPGGNLAEDGGRKALSSHQNDLDGETAPLVRGKICELSLKTAEEAAAQDLSWLQYLQKGGTLQQIGFSIQSTVCVMHDVSSAAQLTDLPITSSHTP